MLNSVPLVVLAGGDFVLYTPYSFNKNLRFQQGPQTQNLIKWFSLWAMEAGPLLMVHPRKAAWGTVQRRGDRLPYLKARADQTSLRLTAWLLETKVYTVPSFFGPAFVFLAMQKI